MIMGSWRSFSPRPRPGGADLSRIYELAGGRRGCAQAGRAQAIVHRGVRHWKPERFIVAPAAAAKPAFEGGAAARAGELARPGSVLGTRFHGAIMPEFKAAARSQWRLASGERWAVGMSQIAEAQAVEPRPDPWRPLRRYDTVRHSRATGLAAAENSRRRGAKCPPACQERRRLLGRKRGLRPPGHHGRT